MMTMTTRNQRSLRLKRSRRTLRAGRTRSLLQSPPPSSGSTSEAGKIAKKAAGFAAGTAVGLPVAFVRLTADAIPEHAKSVPFIGESNNPALKWASRGLMIPTAFFSGFVQAPFYSITNAWNAAVTDDEPFSKESFYLGEDAAGLTSD
jgi:hypothetical protein